jgi:hypothetical protein
VRGYSEAHAFKERGVNQIVPAFRLKDCTNYESKEMVDLFGANETPWDDIWMPVNPTYAATRDATWKARPKQRQLALRQKEVYELNKTDLAPDRRSRRPRIVVPPCTANSPRKMAANLAAQVNSATGSTDKRLPRGSCMRLLRSNSHLRTSPVQPRMVPHQV